MPSFNLNFLVERDRCLRDKRLFEDPEFPTSDRSLYYKTAPKKSIEWKRPGVILFFKHFFKKKNFFKGNC